jgi:hypothetical protein
MNITAVRKVGNKMKKQIFAIIFIAALILGATACQKNTPPETSSNTATSISTTNTPLTTLEPSTTQKTLPVYVPGSIKLLTDEEMRATFGDSPYFECHYRDCYYRVDSSFLDLVDMDEWQSIEVSAPGEEPLEMTLAIFIKHFNITREQFDAAVEKEKGLNIKLGIDMTEEMHELPNGDIIYTFDNDIINEYYRRA